MHYKQAPLAVLHCLCASQVDAMIIAEQHFHPSTNRLVLQILELLIDQGLGLSIANLALLISLKLMTYNVALDSTICLNHAILDKRAAAWQYFAAKYGCKEYLK